MATWCLVPELAEWVAFLVVSVDARVRPRVGPLVVGALFAQGRRTVSRWLVAAGVGADFKRYYYALGSLGRKVDSIVPRVLAVVLRVLPTPERVLLVVDDSLTRRYGPKVEGAGLHHNPTPGPANATHAYGHSWVALAWVRRHPLWGAIALPLWSTLYVRAKDLLKLPSWNRWPFRTKLELAADMVRSVAALLPQGNTWVVVDGGYTKRPFLRPVLAAGVTVVARLRKDAALRDVPPPRQPGQRGRPRKYGERIDLARRGRHPKGWSTGEFTLYGRTATKTYKTFVATYPPVGGPVRVVVVREEHGWFAWFCSDPEASVREVLEAVADRGAIEQVFHDVKEVHGAGQQQLRHLYANVAAWNLLCWLYTLVELWAWHRGERELVDRTARPWDDKPRRPSHADKRNALRRACLRATFSLPAHVGRAKRKTSQLLRQLVSLVS